MRGFRHEALIYAGDEEFVRATGAFLREGLDAGEPALVVVARRKIELLREELGPRADGVRFADMDEVGSNPARIIPAWRAFVDEHAGSRLRGIGEPVWPGRSAAELSECRRHESLLNLAFADGREWTLLCPYDTRALDEDALAIAFRTHPHLVADGVRRANRSYEGLAAASAPFAEPLPEPPDERHELELRDGALEAVRRFVAARAAAAGLAESRRLDLVLAVHELAANTIRHGGGRGSLRIWTDHRTLLCEVEDGGRVDRPLVGRERPDVDQQGGWGMWLVNQLCDLVQLRSLPHGTLVRLHMRLA